MNLGGIKLHRVDNTVNAVAVFGYKHTTLVLSLILNRARDCTDKVSHKAFIKGFANGLHRNNFCVQPAAVGLGCCPYGNVPDLSDGSEFLIGVTEAVA